MDIEKRIETLTAKFSEIQGNLEADAKKEIELALSSAKTAFSDANASEGEAKETALDSLNESLSEMEEYFQSL